MSIANIVDGHGATECKGFFWSTEQFVESYKQGIRVIQGKIQGTLTVSESL